jgi:hypothetical protein
MMNSSERRGIGGHLTVITNRCMKAEYFAVCQGSPEIRQEKT